MDMKAIGKQIRQHRKLKGLTQEELAKASELSTMSIRRYESGERIAPEEAIEKIASALGITAFDLMGAEYWDKKYPKIAEESKEYEGFIDYLNSLGYVVKDHYSPTQIPVEEFEQAGKMDIVPEEYIKSGFVPAETHSVELIKDGKSFTLEDDEFDDLQKSTKDMIALKLWQKSQKSK